VPKEADASQQLESLPERVRRSYATLTTRGVDAWIDEFVAPDFIWDVEPMGLSRYEGTAAFREFFADWTVAYAEWFAEPLEIVEFGDEIVVAEVHQGGRPHGSDQLVELRWAQLAAWRGGRIVEAINFPTFDEACAAARARTAPR
jgi:ketosteroid isomerase-like protein